MENKFLSALFFMKGMVISMRKRTKITEQMTQEIRDMYATREFTQNEIAGKFGISITAVNNAIHKGYVPKPKGMTETKERTELIEEHIMEFFDTEEEIVECVGMNAASLATHTYPSIYLNVEYINAFTKKGNKDKRRWVFHTSP